MKSVLDIQVSCFRSYQCAHNPKPVNLLTWLHSAKYAGQVTHIRSLTSKAERDKHKATLPCITPSGEFAYRAEKGLLRHSGLICLDIDYKENGHIGNFTQLKSCLSHIDNIAYCGLSVSGEGYFVLIPVADPGRHKAHFQALQHDFEQLGIQLDEACKDVSRLRGYSHDTEAHFNHEAKAYYKIRSTPEKEVAATKPVRPGKTPPRPGYLDTQNKGSLFVSTKAEELVHKIVARGIDLTDGYRNWFEIGCSFANELGEGGRGFFHQVSQFYKGYTPAATDKQFDACLKYRYRYTIATFYKYCKDFGVTNPAPP